MALIKCTKCGKEFSEHAEVCPSCGLSTSKVQEGVSDYGWTMKHTIRLLISIVVVLLVSFVLIDKSYTLSKVGLLILSIIISYGIGFVWKGVIQGLITTPITFFMLFLMLLFPTVRIIESHDSYRNDRIACFGVYKMSNNVIIELEPTQEYIYNKTGRTLYVTKIGYGVYKSHPVEYNTIPNGKIKNVGEVTYYFENLPNKVKSHEPGAYRQVIDFYKH